MAAKQQGNRRERREHAYLHNTGNGWGKRERKKAERTKRVKAGCEDVVFIGNATHDTSPRGGFLGTAQGERSGGVLVWVHDSVVPKSGRG